MEVVGTIAAATELVSLSTKTVVFLRNLMRDAKVVDATVQTLCRKLELIQSLLAEIAELENQIPENMQKDGNLTRLWSIIRTLRKNFQDTLIELEVILDPLRRRLSNTTPEAVFKQLKLHFRRIELAKLESAISAHQIAFQTTVDCIMMLLAIQQDRTQNRVIDKLDLLGDNIVIFEHRLTNLQDRIDQMTQLLIELKDGQHHSIVNSDTNGISTRDNRQIIASLENLRATAKPILTNASTAMEVMSSRGDDETERLSKRDRIEAWSRRNLESGQIEGLPEKGTAEVLSDAGLEDFKSMSFEESLGSMSGPPIGMSKQKLNIRSRLIQRGVDAYFQSSYQTAMDCFLQALEEGPVGVQDPLLGIMSESTVESWYQLSGLRLRNRPGGIKATQQCHLDLLKAPTIDLNILGATRNFQVCLDACIKSSIFLHLGLIDQAEKACDIARESILRLEGKTSKHYHDVVLLMVEIQYSRGPKEKAKEWCAEVSAKRLKEKFDSFILGKPGPPKPLTASPTVDVNGKYWLLQAVRCGNFPATLFILQNYDSSELRHQRPDLSQTLARIDQPDEFNHLPQMDYLKYADTCGSLATISLLLERHADIEAKTTSSSHESLVRQFLFDSITFEQVAVAKLLLSYGPGRNARDSGPPGPAYATCYPLHSWKLDIDYGAIRTNTFEHAVANGCYDIAHLLLPSAAINGSGSGDYQTEPPLNIAIRCPDGRHLVPFLLKSGADVNIAFRCVRPLALAIYHSSRDSRRIHTNEKTISRRDMVKFLLDAGAEVNRTSVINGKRLTPLQQAQEMNLKHMVELLLQYGARATTATRQSTEATRSADTVIRVRQRSRWWPKGLF